MHVIFKQSLVLCDNCGILYILLVMTTQPKKLAKDLQAKLDLVIGYCRQLKKCIPDVVSFIIVDYIRNYCYWKYFAEGIQFADDNEKLVISFPSQGWLSAFGSNDVIFGEFPIIHEWKMQILALSSPKISLCFGIASDVRFKTSYFCAQPKQQKHKDFGDVYYNYGCCLSNNSPMVFVFEGTKDSKTFKFRVGDVIVVQLNTTKKQMRFVLNEKEIAVIEGIHFSAEVKYKLCVSNFWKGSKIALMPSHM